MRRRYVTLLVAMLCLFSIVGVRGHAVQSRASEQIRNCYVSISQSAHGQLGISFTIRATTNMDVLGVTSIVVQRFNGTSWVSEYTFNIRDYPEMQTNNKSSYSATMSYSPRYSGTQYRAMVFFYARNSAGSDTAVKTTSSVAT